MSRQIWMCIIFGVIVGNIAGWGLLEMLQQLTATLPFAWEMIG